MKLRVKQVEKFMLKKLKIDFILKFIGALMIGIISLSCSEDREPEFKLSPQKAPVESKSTSSVNKNIEAGTGWATGEPEEAIQKALDMALQGKSKNNPDFLIIHPTAGSDSEKILEKARQIVGENTKIYGGTSDARGVLTDGGYVTGAKGGYSAAGKDIEAGLSRVVVMTISTGDINFGVGSASLADHDSPREMAVAALHDAIKSSGKDSGQKPSILLITPTIGIEHEVLSGLTKVVGSDVILLGGTAGGPDGRAIGNNHVYNKGVSLAVFYTDLPIGWVFEAGFEKQDKYSGIVTKMDGRKILEIDHKPAYEVYDGWLGGEVTRRFQQEGGASPTFRDFLSLHPLFRKRQSSDGDTYTIFSHPWAPNKELITSGLNTTTDIKVRDRVYLSYGTWEILLNRIGNLPGNARKTIALAKEAPVALAIGTICAGVMGVIPESERKKFPVLINHANARAPFIASFTWGEQGALPGVGFQHCNLTTSFLVIGNKE
jgi:hypothetical protein